MSSIDEQLQELDELLNKPDDKVDLISIKELTNKIEKSIENKSYEELRDIKESLYNVVDSINNLSFPTNDVIEELLNDLIKEVNNRPEKINTIVENFPKFPDKLKITNLSDIKIPDTVKVEKPDWLKDLKTDELQKVLKFLQIFRQEGLDVTLDRKNMDAKYPIAVRLSDGKKFYNAISAVAAAAGDNSPHHTDISKTHFNFYYTGSSPTDGIVYSPHSSRKWFITDLFIGVSADATVTLEDDKTGGQQVKWTHTVSAKSGWDHSFQTPMYSGEAGADLLVTTDAGTVYIFGSGYEA